MKNKTFLLLVVLTSIVLSCLNSINYSENFKSETAGAYLYNEDDVIAISYDNNTLFFKWRGNKTQPVATAENEFFVPDMYKKFHFVIHPDTNQRYLSIIHEVNKDSISYDYLKAPNGYKTPSEHLKEKNYEAALAGFLKIKAKDSTSEFIQQYKFNRIGYKLMGDKNYEDAIAVFEMNTILHPTKHNVYDSLGQAYLVIGDSLKAYENYKKTLSLNNGNRRAQKYIDTYEAKTK
jgi:tetratricopeptide (TPR) repeat protein